MIYRRITFALLLAFSIVAVLQAQPKPAAPASKPAANPSHDENAHLYRNTTFAFRYQIPYGWVDRTKEMRDQGGPEPDVL